MEYTFFHKNHFLFSANCIRLSGGPVGISGLKKDSGEMPGLFPNPVLNKSERSPSHKFSKIQQEVKAGIKCGTSIYARGIWLSAHPACSAGRNTLFFGGGRVPSWSAPENLSGFLSRLIRLEDC